MVGAVIVRDDVVLGEGFHRAFGEPHAEREALADADRAGHDVRGAMMVVTLEPCCHTGKTPPCTEAVIEAGVSRVVIAMLDPDERVAGKGVAMLREAGVEVVVGVCDQHARDLLAPYITLRTKQRPWVIGKWAQTRDGYWVLPAGTDRWVSNEASRADAHVVRGLCDAIAVGIGTVLTDDPELTARGDQPARQPARIVLDGELRTPPGCKLLQVAESPVLIAVSEETLIHEHPQAEALRSNGAEIIELPGKGDRISPEALCAELGSRQFTYLIVEGGPSVMQGFLDAGVVDELQVYIAPRDARGLHADDMELSLLPRLDVNVVARNRGFALIDERDLDGDCKRTYRLSR